MALRTEMRTQGNFLFKYRSYLPIVVLLLGLGLYTISEFDFTSGTGKNNGVYELVCLAICLLGLGIRFYTIGHASDATSGRNTSEGQVADSLNTSGLYSWCRHPLYVGNFFMWFGLCAFTQDFWFMMFFVFAYWVYYERIMYAEEEFLIDKFGDKYLYYATRVPAFFPVFKRWVKPSKTFSWKKVIKQEKAGILNLFVVILLMRCAEEYYDGTMHQLERYWIVVAIAASLWYLTIKLLQKTTTIFEVQASGK